MTSYENPESDNQLESTDSGEALLIEFSDGMDPLTFPHQITEDNYQEVFGSALPEGLSPEIFKDGGSLRLSE